MKTKSDEINDIIKKIYASELGLIENAPPVKIRRRNFLSRLRAKLWKNQSLAMKVAAMALFFAAVSATVYYYNSYVINYYNVVMERAQVEAQLQRRNDLIPNLVTVASNYMSYERDVFTHVADVRAAVKSLNQSIEKTDLEKTALERTDIKKSDQMPVIASQSSAGQSPDKTIKGTDKAALDKAGLDKAGIKAGDMSVLSKFQAVAEAYPALKSSETYTILLKELSDTETRIVEMRISYNKQASFYNSRLKMFPGKMFNYFLGFEELPLFESEELAKSFPKVQ